MTQFIHSLFILRCITIRLSPSFYVRTGTMFKLILHDRIVTLVVNTQVPEVLKKSSTLINSTQNLLLNLTLCPLFLDLGGIGLSSRTPFRVFLLSRVTKIPWVSSEPYRPRVSSMSPPHLSNSSHYSWPGLSLPETYGNFRVLLLLYLYQRNLSTYPSLSSQSPEVESG